MDLRKPTLIAGLLFSVASGSYLGLYGCGGYVWHWHLQSALELLLATAWAVLTAMADHRRPANERRPFTTFALCVGIYFVLHAVFVTSMAIIGPFYPEPPTSLNEWWRGFLFTWREGVPC